MAGVLALRLALAPTPRSGADARAALFSENKNEVFGRSAQA